MLPLLCVLASVACTDDTYVIGAVCNALATCPSAGAGGSGHAGAGGAAAGAAGLAGTAGTSLGGFALDLTGSGPERLPQQLFGEDALHLLIATDATASSWPARVGDGFDVAAGALPQIAEPWPFADRGSALSHAGLAAYSANSDWASAVDGAWALEAVFRAEPGALLLAQLDGKADGMRLAVSGSGQLSLQVTSSNGGITVTSQPLVPDAWHHCLALVDRSQGAQIICNGQAGDVVDVPSGLSMASVAATATLGDAAPARVHWAELASWQASSWGARGAWPDTARERFARLVGTYADGAKAPLPLSEVRPSGAYIDMSPVDAPEQRRLHPVGQHWPRIVCRPTSDSPRFCGLLLESSSSLQVAPASFTLDHWDAAELGVAAGTTGGSLGTAGLFALAPTTAQGAHTLSFEVTFADGPAVLSFFARALGKKLLRVDVPGIASAAFDLAASTVVESSGTRVVSAEPWGDGLVRVSYSFDVGPGPGSLQLSILDDDGASAFAGSGDVAAEVGEGELRFRSFSTPLPTFGSIQAEDSLVFPAGNGNFPSGGAFEIDAEFWLPAAPLLADAAILNANFAMQYEQQINLFVTAQQSVVRFQSLLGKTAPWTVTGAATVTDGNVHHLAASVAAGEASLSVDGATLKAPAEAYDTSKLDRIEVGASKTSSGALTGMVRRLSISEP
jgi:hypothetical protein